VTQSVQTEVARRDHLAATLRAADIALASVQARLDRLHQRRVDSEAERAALAAQKRQASAELNQQQQDLVIELNAAYRQAQEPILSKWFATDITEHDRKLVGYVYRVRARQMRLHNIEQQKQKLSVLDEALALQDQRLAALEEDRRHEAQALDKAKTQQSRALDELSRRVASRSQALKELQANAASLENLLVRLKRALKIPAVPAHRSSAHPPPIAQGLFVSLKGHLPWPAAGRLAAHFGEPRVGGMRWNGLLIETKAHADIRAPAAGRVIYADWLPGLGLLVILEHSDGYISLYGNNERVAKTVGDRVTPGEILATSGDDSTRPTLYFEIRQGAQPIDPLPWLQSSGSMGQ
jgi:septal ring factor EnvC (AmiA/AmiB activator)